MTLLFVCIESGKSNLFKLETSCTVILPPTVSVLWMKAFKMIRLLMYIGPRPYWTHRFAIAFISVPPARLEDEDWCHSRSCCWGGLTPTGLGVELGYAVTWLYCNHLLWYFSYAFNNSTGTCFICRPTIGGVLPLEIATIFQSIQRI